MKILQRLTAPVLFASCGLLALTWSVLKPMHNWDMIGYIGAAKSFSESDMVALHASTYALVRQAVSDARYVELASPPHAQRYAAYRRAISSDPTAFAEQLPFYQVRPVYTGAIYLLDKLGVEMAFGTHLLPALGVFLGVLLLYAISGFTLAPPLVYAVPPLIFIFGALPLGRISTPDGLAFGAVVASAYLFLRGHQTALLCLLPLMVGIRSDLVLFGMPFYVILLVQNRGRRGRVLASALVCVVFYQACMWYWSNQGWATAFYSSFIEILVHPISSSPTLDVADYVYVLARGTYGLLSNESFLLYSLLAGCSAWLAWRRAEARSLEAVVRSPAAALAFVCAAFVASHFLLYPLASDRYFVGEYLIGAWALLAMISEAMGEGGADPATPPDFV